MLCKNPVEMAESPDKIRIEYVKSHLFRVVHCDGAIGGTTPRLQLLISFYNERFPIPKVLTFEPTATGAPGREILHERESKEGIIREVEFGIMLDLPAAKNFATWLNERISELEKTREQVLGPHVHSEEIPG